MSNSRSGDSGALFWPLWVLHVCCADAQVGKSPTHIKKIKQKDKNPMAFAA